MGAMLVGGVATGLVAAIFIALSPRDAVRALVACAILALACTLMAAAAGSLLALQLAIGVGVVVALATRGHMLASSRET
jgi:hypothetical protein